MRPPAVASARLTARRRSAQHGYQGDWRIRMTLTRDRKSALLSQARLFDGVDAERGDW
jgi:hypothetical protein